MGFDDGQQVGDPNENGVCGDFKGVDHCGDPELPIIKSEMDCRGNEAEFFDCGGTIDTSNCNHDMDVII